jgi:hypothetical protein
MLGREYGFRNLQFNLQFAILAKDLGCSPCCFANRWILMPRMEMKKL